ncbi:5002_t:CDS:2 [Funneliformis geosporum]|uniref:19997_t:CDS:1 n=1 Tax=Funneliformis geosporum TaxID=1117311 RepID=A0A9W4SFF5_9GLOM|nr:5002_t:CDS:2 [Funneliformis geosporum]CAI2166455.1 19997_t:CDS:2 [Funneliformis geosporum]
MRPRRKDVIGSLENSFTKVSIDDVADGPRFALRKDYKESFAIAHIPSPRACVSSVLMKLKRSLKFWDFRICEDDEWYNDANLSLRNQGWLRHMAFETT